jgi:hypothetical protein
VAPTFSQAITVYPNPTKNVLKVVARSAKIEIDVVDATGRICLNAAADPNGLVDATSLRSGVYVLRVRSNGTVEASFRFVKE